MQSFEKVSPISLLETVLTTIRAKIIAGELKAGEWLPPERDMAEQMGVSRSSLHQAILELEYQGFVSVIPRRGTVVCDFRKYPTAQSLEALMSNDSLNLEYSLFKDMMEFRLNVESECARLACDNIYDSTLAEMEDILTELSAPDADVADLIYSFHYKLTQASGNSMYSMVFRGFEAVIKNMIAHHFKIRPGDLEEGLTLRRELIALLKEKDAEGAAACVRKAVTQGINVLEMRYE